MTKQDETTKQDERVEQTQKHEASEEAGQRAAARPPGGSGVSSGLQPGGTNPSTGTNPTGTLGGLGSIGTRGGSTAPAEQGLSGQVTNDMEPHGGTVGDDPDRQDDKPRSDRP